MLLRLLLTLLVVLPSCALRLEPPTGFLELKNRRHPYAVQQLATTAEGGRLVVRRFDDFDEGTLDFWVDTLHYDLQARGYTHVDTSDVQDGRGAPGRCLRYSIRANGLNQGYLIALFVLDNDIATVEFTAVTDAFEANWEAVRDALSTLR